MNKIGINLISFPDMTDEDVLRAAAELGFGAIFTGVMEDEARQMRCAELMARLGLDYEMLHAPFGHINDIWLEGEGGDAMLKELKDCVDRCAKVGAKFAVVHLSSGENPPSITDIGRARWAKLAEYAKDSKVQIAFENQRKLANLAWAMETFSPEDSVGFCWDCGHEVCFASGREYMPLFGDRLICTHIHDNEGVRNKDDHWIPFDGNLDYNRFAQHIRRSGYQGTLMLELAYKRPRYEGMPAREYLERAAKAAKRLAKMVDE